MLEWSDNDFKATIINMLDENLSHKNSWNKGEIESISKEIKDTKKRQMEILKLETKILKTVQSELRKKNTKNEKEEHNLWNKNKGLTFVSLKSQKKRRKSAVPKTS